MNDEIKGFLVIMAVIMAIIIFCDWHERNESKTKYEQGYKDACADFYQGKLKYDLVTNPDGTREWKKVERQAR